MKPIASKTDHGIALEKLSAACPTHGTVPVVCPRCAGKAGGKAHRGTRSRRKRELKAIEDARRVLDISPEAKLLEGIASERKEFQDVADKMGWTKDERELLFTRMFLADGVKHLGELSDRMGLPPEERAKLLEEHAKIRRPGIEPGRNCTPSLTASLTQWPRLHSPHAPWLITRWERRSTNNG